MPSTAFFCIPGAFCPGSFYSKLIALLREKGHNAYSVDLPSMDPDLRSKGKTPGFYDDAAHVRNIISGPLSDLREGADVVLVASSYGTSVTNEACKGLTPSARDGSIFQIKHLILLGGLLAEPGQTVAELIGANVLGGENAEEHIIANGGYVDPPNAAIAGYVLCGNLPEEERNHYVGMLKPICMQAFMQNITFAAWEEVPTTSIIGQRDLAVPAERQIEYFEKAVERGIEGLKTVVIEGGDHLPMLSAPERILEVCLHVIGNKA